ncbi:hypothetical protein HK097_000632, partial [Rhizophlyctis rosea]
MALSSWSQTALLLAKVFTDSLLEPSIYDFVATLIFVIFGGQLGRIIDFYPRLTAISLLAILLWVLSYLSQLYDNDTTQIKWAYAACTLIGIVIRFAGTGVAVSLERDWAVVLSGGRREWLVEINTYMQITELVCRISAPLTISSLSTEMKDAMMAIGVMSSGLLVVGLVLVPVAWRLCPALAVGKGRDRDDDEDSIDGDVTEGREQVGRRGSGDSRVSSKASIEVAKHAEGTVTVRKQPTHTVTPDDHSSTSNIEKADKSLETFFQTYLHQWSTYFHHPILLTSLSISVTRFTIISFTSIMTTYMIFHDQSPSLFAYMRSTGVGVGILAVIVVRFVVPVYGV